jgi:hypothetical protein
VIEFGILVALASAVGINISRLCKHRGAVAVRTSKSPVRCAALVIVATAFMPARIGAPGGRPAPAPG